MEIKIFSKPILVEELVKGKFGRQGKFKCCCGVEFVTYLTFINTGKTKSCGCYKLYKTALTHTTHGKSSSIFNKLYRSIKNRCNNPNEPAYKNYGGRGIKMCEEWANSFLSFYTWMELNNYKKGLEIDRIDNNLGYGPDNCRLVTRLIQATNKRRSNSNKTGFVGVYVHLTKQGKIRYRAMISIKGSIIRLGDFKTPEEASMVYEKALIERNNLYLVEFENGR